MLQSEEDYKMRLNPGFQKSNFVKAALLAIAAFALASFPAKAAWAGHFVYTNDDVPAGNTVTTFAVKKKGMLVNLGQTVTTGNGNGGGFYGSNRIAAVKHGKFLLAANDGDNPVTVSVFSGARKGNLTLLGLLALTNTPADTSIASLGKCAVVASGTAIYSFTTKSFNPVSSTDIGMVVDDIAIAKRGGNRYVAASLINNNEIGVLPISPKTCALGSVTTFATSGSGGRQA
jgi:hypothetical protein